MPPAAAGEPTRAATVVDAWLCIHGTGSNFYAASTLAGLAPKLLAGGSAVLRANTRGHDLLATGPSSAGAACKARRSNASTKRRSTWPPGSSCSASAGSGGSAC